MEEIVFLNGELLPVSGAFLPVDDRSLLFGDSAFETLKAYRGSPFRLSRHLERLAESCRMLRMKPPIEPAAIRDAVVAVIESNGLSTVEEARVRITVTGGPADSSKGLARPGPAGIFITAKPYQGLPPRAYKDGITVVISGIKRNVTSPLSSLKTGNYLESMFARQEALDRGADDAVMLTGAGNLAEATSSNLFMVKEETVLTPNSGCGFLPGVTRETVMEICAAERIPLKLVMEGPERLMDSDEAFLTNSMFEILPVARVVTRSLGSSCPGPVTARIAHLYRELTASETRSSS